MNLEQFKELFNPLPGNRYLHVTTTLDAIDNYFYTLLEGVSGELALAYYSEDLQKPAIEELYPKAKIQYINNFVHPFRALPREHDMVILKDVFTKHHKPEQLLNSSYKTLANTAHIIIMEKKGELDLYAIEELLEKFEFRAANSIDIVEGYDLVMAKKMHMWGNGL